MPGQRGVALEVRLDRADAAEPEARRCRTATTRTSGQARSSAGSDRWANSQSSTATIPVSSTIRLPMRKSPWLTTRGRSSGNRSRHQPIPSSIAGCGSSTRSSSRVQPLPEIAIGQERGSAVGWDRVDLRELIGHLQLETRRRRLARFDGRSPRRATSSITNASRPSRSPRYAIGSGTCTLASRAATRPRTPRGARACRRGSRRLRRDGAAAPARRRSSPPRPPSRRLPRAGSPA